MTAYLIVGAGVFGLSTAYHLLLGGEKRVTVIDRALTLPAKDGASTDLNRIVRTSYSSSLYTELAQRAISRWNSDFPGVYHESGVLLLGESMYTLAARQNDDDAGVQTKSFPDIASVHMQYPDLELGSLDAQSGYLNISSGWADAELGMSTLLGKVQELGGVVLTSREATGLTFDVNGKACGVKIASGNEMVADAIILAAGAWTASTFRSELLELPSRVVATGQSIACVRLTSEETLRYKHCPVFLNFDTGFYVFPPKDDGLLKFAIHHGGYINPDNSEDGTSKPRTLSTHGKAGLGIPRAMASQLREGLASVFPKFAERPFAKTRLCWYADTEDSDWLIDQHPTHSNIYFATGGSGHAYKFLPVLGDLVVRRIKKQLTKDEASTFSYNRAQIQRASTDRMGRKVELLVESDLVTAEAE